MCSQSPFLYMRHIHPSLNPDLGYTPCAPSSLETLINTQIMPRLVYRKLMNPRELKLNLHVSAALVFDLPFFISTHRGQAEWVSIPTPLCLCILKTTIRSLLRTRAIARVPCWDSKRIRELARFLAFIIRVVCFTSVLAAGLGEILMSASVSGRSLDHGTHTLQLEICRFWPHRFLIG